MPDRRFPPPWSVDDSEMKLDQNCVIWREALRRDRGVGLFIVVARPNCRSQPSEQ
jgi:hypothetical protein